MDSCRDVVNILGRLSCDGLGEEEVEKVLRMKEIAMGIVSKRPRVVTMLGCEPSELVCMFMSYHVKFVFCDLLVHVVVHIFGWLVYLMVVTG